MQSTNCNQSQSHQQLSEVENFRPSEEDEDTLFTNQHSDTSEVYELKKQFKHLEEENKTLQERNNQLEESKLEMEHQQQQEQGGSSRKTLEMEKTLMDQSRVKVEERKRKSTRTD